MASNTTKPSKSEKRRQREYERRRDSFETEYVRTKYPKVYDEAVEFYNNLREEYPEKHDLRKTNEFKQWKSMQKKRKQEITGTPEPPPKTDNKHDLRKTNEFKQWKSMQEKRKQEITGTPEPPPKTDNMVLRIPLWNTSTLTSVQSLQTVSMEVLGEGTIYPSLQEEISSELIEEVLNELRQDPDLKDMFEMVETEFEQIGAEIEITEDNRLENELLQW